MPTYFYFDHVETLSDTERLKVLRTPADIVRVGISLNNCAANFIEKAAAQNCCVLVAHYDYSSTSAEPANKRGKRKKPTALGMYKYDAEKLDDDWSQVAMAANKEPTREILQVYNEYKDTIRRWWEQEIKDGINPAFKVRGSWRDNFRSFY